MATTLTRCYARAPGGMRAVGRVPAGYRRHPTLLGGLSAEGLCACMPREAAVDTRVCLAFVREVLVPELKPGQVVVLDNLSAHQAAEVEPLITAAGCRLLYLPPYSPDLKPIEPCWSKLKGCSGPPQHAPKRHWRTH